MALLQMLQHQVLPDFETVAAIKTHITTTNPHRFSTINVNMCVYSIVGFAQGTRIELIDHAAAAQFSEVSPLLANLTDRERLQYVFRLAVWAQPDHVHLQPGSTVRVSRVDHLTVWGGISPQGTVDIQRLPNPAPPRAPPRPTTTVRVDGDAQQLQPAQPNTQDQTVQPPSDAAQDEHAN